MVREMAVPVAVYVTVQNQVESDLQPAQPFSATVIQYFPRSER